MRIFNQLRKLQVEKYKIKNYLIYALGEIILIVFGILIALQINNWNQEMSTRKEQLEALKVLEQTFQANATEIDRALNDFDRLLTKTNTRINYSGPQKAVVSDSLIQLVRQIDVVKLNLVNEGSLSTQNLSLLSGEVRNLLLEYSTEYKAYKQLENNVNNLSMKLRENHQQYVSLLTQRNYHEEFIIDSRNVFPSDYPGWMSDRDCQNLSVEIKWKAGTSVDGLEKLKEINTVILWTILNKLYPVESQHPVGLIRL